jgi:hypothetical protein
MANTTAWTGGTLNSGLGWTVAVSNADLTTGTPLANLRAIISSGTAIANDTGLDQLVDISFVGTIASTTLAAGANISVYLYMLLQDGTTYGDNSFSAGTGNANSITVASIGQTPFCILPMSISGAATTKISGQANGAMQGLWIPPGKFLFALGNNLAASGATPALASTSTLYFRSYNQNLNR